MNHKLKQVTRGRARLASPFFEGVIQAAVGDKLAKAVGSLSGRLFDRATMIR
jgi:hypothetical protein